MYPFEVVKTIVHYDFFHKVPLAPSMCLFKWIKVDKLDYLKIGSSDFKNYFYFRMVSYPSIPGMRQKLRLVKRPFRSRSKQSDYLSLLSKTV
jgi:hypothetical protein